MIGPIAYSLVTRGHLSTVSNHLDARIAATSVAIFTLPCLRLPEFLLGCVLGLLFLSGYRTRLPVLWIGLVGFFVSVINSGSVPITLSRAGYLDLFICLVIYGLATTEKGFLTSPLMQALGDASYEVYILQVPILAIGLALAHHSGITNPIGDPKVLAADIVVLILASHSMRRYVADPLRLRIRSLMAPRVQLANG
jgi:peptidoglycan/LPS O-acetylase OafA/YrhL